MALPPQVLAALVQGGMSILGGGMSGFGGAQAAREDREQERNMFNRQMADKGIDREQGRQQFERTAGMQGIGMLADMRATAAQRARHQQFKDALYRASQGVK
jgi:hypothetical protein